MSFSDWWCTVVCPNCKKKFDAFYFGSDCRGILPSHNYTCDHCKRVLTLKEVDKIWDMRPRGGVIKLKGKR